MGIVIKWRTPDLTEATYDLVYIYRAASETGTYIEIANQSASDTTYFDCEGNSSNWYKIRFYKTSTACWSNWSEPIQGGTFTGYCTPDDVRTVADMPSNELTDSQLWDIIQFAQAMLSKELNSRIIEERVVAIDSDVRQNKIDGQNKDYYVQKSYEWFLGDTNGDGEVNAEDVIVWAYDTQNDIKTKRTVASVDPELGKITLESAPPSDLDLYITYTYCPVNVNTPDPMVKMACAFLAAALGFTKIDARCFDKMSAGKLSFARQQKSFAVYYDQYRQHLNLIKTRLLRRTDDPDRFIYP